MGGVVTPWCPGTLVIAAQSVSLCFVRRPSRRSRVHDVRVSFVCSLCFWGVSYALFKEPIDVGGAQRDGHTWSPVRRRDPTVDRRLRRRHQHSFIQLFIQLFKPLSLL